MLHEDSGNVSYSAIGALSDRKRELRESIELRLMNPELFLRVGIKPPKFPVPRFRNPFPTRRRRSDAQAAPSRSVASRTTLQDPSAVVLLRLSLSRHVGNWAGKPGLLTSMAPGRRKDSNRVTAVGQLNLGDLVLAKVKGYPAWPAKVSSICYILDSIL
ncbi:hypothetical protein ZIOFF_073699 [Zingiber officinale]|uniref:PWWP domain-containing protein n=1 Tax=Zingiber officinale TaxID=94328 RepID=A0A8J5ETV0_ZINOF|nr:hypothetical protein ZIOFF_073699 [Zingiber officinale]